MAAIISGNNLGLSTSSLKTLGDKGVSGNPSQGSAGENVYVDASNGNLVIQRRDEILMESGLPIETVRTYNSEGTLDGDNNDNWRIGFHKSVSLTGTANAVDSTLTRTDGDGAVTVFQWDEAHGNYRSTDGDGAYDTIAYSTTGAPWTFIDGSTQIRESYDASGRITGVADPSGNTLAYAYDVSARLTSVQSSNGEKTVLEYSGVNVAKIDVQTLVNGVLTTTSRVSYSYDTSNRLSKVTVDLTPDNTGDSSVYETTYAYAGASDRVAMMTQSDGTRLNFGYVQDFAAGTYKIATITDGLNRTTTINYNYGSTEVVDPLGLRTTFGYDAAGQLQEVDAPGPYGFGERAAAFYYDGSGNVTRMIDGEGRAVDMEYDANGNAVLRRDALGDTITRTFDAANRLTTETVWALADADGSGTASAPGAAETKRYIYDDAGHGLLRYEVSAEGRVTQHQYNAAGQQTATIQYTNATFALSSYGVTALPDEATLNAWTAAIPDMSQAVRTDFGYDFRGLMSTSTTYDELDVLGAGVPGTASTTHYVFDQAGRLRQSVIARAVAGSDGTTRFLYDGLDRVIFASDALGNQTLTIHDDLGQKTIVEIANNLWTTTYRDAAGEIFKVSESTGAAAGLGDTLYFYDADGRLREVRDPTGVRHFTIYDERGRKSLEIDGDGSATGYWYDASDRLLQTIRYAQRVSVADGVDATTLTRAMFDFPPSNADRRVYNTYDAAGRLVGMLDGEATLTQTVYDGASRVTETIGYASVGMSTPSVDDRHTRNLYDKDGLLIGVVDADNFLTEYRYDAAGQRTETVRHADPVVLQFPPVVETRPNLAMASAGTTITTYGVDARGADGLISGIPANWQPDLLNPSIYLNFDASKTIDSVVVSGQAANITVAGWNGNAWVTLATVTDNRQASCRLAFNAFATDRIRIDVSNGNYAPRLTQIEAYGAEVTSNRVNVALSSGGTRATSSSSVGSSSLFAIDGDRGSLSTDNSSLGWKEDPAGPKPAWLQLDFGGVKTIDNVIVYSQQAGYPHVEPTNTMTFTDQGLVDFSVQGWNGASWVTLGTVIGNNLVKRSVTFAAFTTQRIRIVATQVAGSQANIAEVEAWGVPAPGPRNVALAVEGTTASASSGLPGQFVINNTLGGVASTGWLDGTPNQYPDWLQLNFNGKKTIDSVVTYSGTPFHVYPTDTTMSVTGGMVDFSVQGWDGASWVTLGTVAGNNLVKRAVNFAAFTTDKIRIVVTQALGGTTRLYEVEANGVDAETPPPVVYPGPPVQGPPTIVMPAPSGDDIHEYSLYNARGQLSGTVNGDGALTEYVYDKDGNLSRTVGYFNRVAYTAGATLASLRPASDPQDQVVERIYDALNRCVMEANPDGLTTTYKYDAVGHLVTATRTASNGEKRTVTSRYDVQGNLIGELTGRGSDLLTGSETVAQLDALYQQFGTTYSYDAAGRRTRSLDANGNLTIYFYDKDGRVTHTINSAGEIERREYNAFGQVEKTTRYGTRAGSLAGLTGGLESAALCAVRASNAALDSVSLTAYDRRGLVATQTDAQQFDTIYHYDAFGDLTSSSAKIDATHRLVQSYQYNHRGLVTTAIRDSGGLNLSTTTEYDAFGRAITVTEGGRTRRSTYDNVGRVVQTTDGTQAQRSSTYDAFGRVATQTDALWNTTIYSYDPVLRSVTITTPDQVSVSTFRDSFGETVRVRDGNGVDTTYEYDHDGNLRFTRGPLASTENRYDRGGRLLETVDERGTVTHYDYDPASRVFMRHVDFNGLNLTTTTTYDAKGQVLDVTDPNGSKTRYQWDLDGQLKVKTVDFGGLNLATLYDYDGQGRTLKVTQPNGSVTTYVYDALGRRIEEHVDPDHLDLTTRYEYNARDAVIAVTDPLNHRTRYFRDGEDRECYAVDSLGTVTQTLYDAEGRVTSKTVFDQPIDLDTLGADPTVDQLFWAVYNYSWDAGNRTQSYIRDAAGRVTYEVGAAGLVTKRDYDANGNVVELAAYATALPQGTDRSQWSIEAWAPYLATIDPSSDRHEYYQYDAANRLTFTVDGRGSVTGFMYDAHGNVIQSTQYATAIAAGTDPALVPSSFDDRVTRTIYDAANRAVFVIDPKSAVFENQYDANGNVVSHTSYALNAAPFDPHISAATFRSTILRTISTLDRVTRAVYDAADRAVFEVDASGAVVENTYDGNGNVVTRSAYARTVQPFSSSIGVAAFRATVLQLDATNDRIEHHVYDASDRDVYDVDALGYVTRNDRDAMGQVTRTIAYGVAIGTGTTMTIPAIEALVPATPGAVDRVHTYVYDAAGRELSCTTEMTDNGSFTESYTYDALGNKLTFTNKNGAIWNYEYDAAGNLLQETSPSVTTTAMLPNVIGQLIPTTTTQPIVTVMAYDALGQLLSRTEASGLFAQERTTTYKYDAAGHQVRTTYPAVPVLGQTGNVSLYTEVTYNVFGEAVANRDTAGNYSYKSYDVHGRVEFEVDAEGGVTEHQHNAFGDTWGTLRYGGAINVAALTPASVPSSGAFRQMVIDAGLFQTYRRVSTSFDALGRVTAVSGNSVLIATVTAGAPGAGGLTKETNPVETSTFTKYNAFGDVIAEGSNRDAIDATIAYTQYFYDRDGRRTASVDALGYVTKMAYDAVGNLTDKTEYATASVGWHASTIAAQAPTVAAAPHLDRETRYQYDADNRKKSETQVAVDYTGASGNAVDLADLTTNYTYDSVGNLTSTTDATGAVTYTYYDALGHINAVVSPSRTDNTTTPTTTITPVTEFMLDAFGNVARKIDYARGVASGVSTSGYSLVGTSADDRSMDALRDAEGHVIESVDALGHQTFDAYYAGGNLGQQAQAVMDETTLRQIATTYVYDKVGRQKQVIEHVWDSTTPVITENHYNVYGEKIQTTVGGSADGVGEKSDYDDAGRVWRTNSGDGVWKVYLYDFTGAVSAELRSTTVDISSLASASDVFNNLAAYVIKGYQHDVLGRVTATVDGLNTAPPQPSGYWMPQDEDIFRLQLEVDYSAFFGWTLNQSGGWAGGTLTRNEGDYATWVAPSGTSYQFRLSDGPIPLIGRSAELRAGLQQQYTGLAFVQTPGSYIADAFIPGGTASNGADLKGFRAAEQSFYGYFDQPYDSIELPWMGGFIRRTSQNVAVFRLAGQPDYTFQRSTGFLAVATANATIRNGWAQDFNFSFVGDSGEKMEQIGILDSNIASDGSGNYATLAWGDLSELGDGDVKVVVDYHDTNNLTHEYSQVFSSRDSAKGVSLQWSATYGHLTDLDQITIYKKDVAGTWQQVVSQQAGQAAAGVVGSIFTATAPDDPAIVVKATIGGADAAPPINFGNRLLFSMPTVVAGGTLDYTIWYTYPGLADRVAHSVGTIVTPIPPTIDALAVSVAIDPSSGMFTWSPGLKRFNPNAIDEVVSARFVNYRPSDYDQYRQLEAATALYFDSINDFPVSSQISWMGGTLTRLDADSARFDRGGNSPASFTFTRSDSCLWIAAHCQAIREGWTAQFAAMGLNLTFLPYADGFFAAREDTAKFKLIESDFDALFQGGAGDVAFMGGTFHRTGGNVGYYTFNGTTITVNRSDGPLVFIHDSDAVRVGWELSRGLALTSGKWVALGTAHNSDVAHTVDFSPALAGTGAGTYQYEIVVEKGLKPTEHAVGYVEYTAASAAFSTGLQAVNDVSLTVNGTVVTWARASGDTAVLKYRVAGSGNAFSAPVAATPATPTTFTFDLANAAGVVPAAGATQTSWEFVIDYAHAGTPAPYGETKVALTVTPGTPAHITTVPLIGVTALNTNTPLLAPYRTWISIDEGTAIWGYGQPFASGYEGSTPIFNPGYGAPYTINSDGVRVYGDAVSLVNNVVAELKFAKPATAVYKVFSYEFAGSNTWYQLPVDSPAGNDFVVDVSSLGTGLYNYRMEYFNPGGPTQGPPLWHSDGIFTLTQGQQGSVVDQGMEAITTPLSTASPGFVTWAAPANGTVADFRYRPSGGLQWTAVPVQRSGGNFQAAISSLANGNFDYQIYYTLPGQQPYATAAGTLSLAAQPGLMPSNAQGMYWLQTDTDQYFQWRAPGTMEDWGAPQSPGGQLFRSTGDTSYFIPGAANGAPGTIAFSNDVQAILNNIPAVRDGWASEFGITWTQTSWPTYVPTSASLVAANDAAMRLYFDDMNTYQIYSSMSWCGGTLTKVTSARAQFVDAAGNICFFDRGDSTQKVGNMSAAIRAGWLQQMGLDFVLAPANTWIADAQEKYDAVVTSVNNFFTRPDLFPPGSATPWPFPPGATGMMLRGKDPYVGYFTQSAFEWQRTQILQAVATNPTMKQIWEAQFAQFNLTFIPAKSVTITPRLPDNVGGGGQLIASTPTTLTVNVNTTPIQIYTDAGSSTQYVFDPPATTSTFVTGQAMPARYSTPTWPVTDPGPQPLSVSLGTESYAPRITSDITASVYGQSIGPTVLTGYDRWGNVTSVSDARNAGWTTTYQYNAMNEVTSETKAAVATTSITGVVTTSTTQTLYGYDALGRQVLKKDASAIAAGSSGVVNLMKYDAAGDLVEEDHADGWSVKYGYDAFGDLTRGVDANGNLTTHKFDKNGQLTKDTFAATDQYYGLGASVSKVVQSRTVSYGYDEAGRRISMINGDLTRDFDKTIYKYDERGDLVTETTLAQVSTYQWDARKRKIFETTPSITSGQTVTQSWTYDGISNRTSTWVNLNGDTTSYSYDTAGRLREQQKRSSTNAMQQDLVYGYDARDEVTSINETNYIAETGHPTVIEKSLTTNTYDAAGNKLGEHYEQDGVTYQDNALTYDAQGRLTQVVDSRHHVEITYDANGNRRSVIGDFYLDDSTQAGAPTTHTENWYAYDAMSRVLIENGALRDGSVYDGTVHADIQHGTQYAYDGVGNKTSATSGRTSYPMNGSGTDGPQQFLTEFYTYDAENRLTRSALGPDSAAANYGNTTSTPLFNTTGNRAYDTEGRLKYAVTYNLSKTADIGAAGGDDYADTVYNDYNLKGQLETQTDIDHKNAQRYTLSNTYDNAGNLSTAHLHYRSDFDDYYTYTNVAGSSYQQQQVKLDHQDHRSGHPSAISYSNFTYDGGGNLIKIEDTGDKTKNRRFVNDAAGTALARVDGLDNSAFAINTPLTVNALASASPAVRIRHSLVVDEQTLGISAMSLDGAPALTRFDFGAQSSGNIGDAPAHYVVTSSDAARGLASLQGVAQAIYGDSSLWYVIAEANGINKASDLKEGLSLAIPNSVSSSHNDLRTFKPYNPADIRGDNQPTLPPPQGGNNGCGTMGAILIAAIAIVATIYTVGAAAAFFEPMAAVTTAGAAAGTTLGSAGAFSAGLAVMGGTTAATTGTLVAAGAIGGAVGSAVSQGVAIAAGMQDSFSWRSVAGAALGSGLSAGIAPYLDGVVTGVTDMTAQSSPNAFIAARTATSTALRQGLMVATGMQKQFSWAGIAASAVAAPIAGTLGGELGESVRQGIGGSEGGTIGGIVRDFAAGFTSQVAVTAAMGGKVRLSSIAADAFGNALGQGLVDATAPRPAGFDIEDAENGQAMRANAARVSAGADYTAVGSHIFDQLAQALGEQPSSVTYGDKYAEDADRMDVIPAFRDLTVDPHTGKASFAYTSWRDSDAEQALFGSALIDGSTERNGSRRSFYISEGGAAFGNPGLGFATGDPDALVRTNARLEAGVAGIEDSAVANGNFAKFLGAQFIPRSVEGWVGFIASAPLLGEAVGVVAPALTRVAPVLGRDLGSFFAPGDQFVGPTIGRSGFQTPSQMADALLERYATAVNEAHTAVTAGLEDGTLRVPEGVRKNTFVGQQVDKAARADLRQWLIEEGIPEGPDGLVQLNRRLYDASGQAYRIPDVRVPSANVILDATVGDKFVSTPQVRDFISFSNGNRVYIVRPQQQGGWKVVYP